MNKQFTKEDLKVGYVVRTRVGDLYMVMPVVNGMSLVKETGSAGMPLGVYNKDMQHDAVLKDTSYDITEVYGHSVFSAFSLDISTEHRLLLWKREEPKEMTIEEIEKALGYPVKIVNK